MSKETPLSQFLSKHYIKKDENTTKCVTNTRIGDKSSNIYGGSYHIPEQEYETFMKLYFIECIKGKKKEYLTEAQLKENGPIVIDVDFRYDYSVTERKHTNEHIIDLITLYLEEFKIIYQIDESVKIPFFVFEKEKINRVEDKKITKDGIHIIIGIQCANHYLQTIIRKSIVEKIPDIWSDIPITNNWNEVFDEGISKGHTNLQLYGSMKPNNEPYRLVKVYIGGYNENGGIEFQNSQSPESYENEKNIYKLSIRYPDHIQLLMTDETIDKLRNFQQHQPITINNKGEGGGNGNIRYELEDENTTLSISEILSIRSKEELDICISKFLESLDLKEYNLRDAFEYTMILPKSYYNEGSFSKWIRVGWALKNIRYKLFIVWLAFSSKSSTFCWATDVELLYEKWKNFDYKNGKGYSIRSIMYWAKNDNPEDYKKISKNSIDAYINKTLDNAIQMNGEDDNKIRGFTDYDIASVLYHLYKDEYVCVSIKNNIWYRFKGHCWVEIDSGTTLRKSISETLRDLYYDKLRSFNRLNIPIEGGDQQQKKNTDRKKTILSNIVEKLGKTADKKNIMTESKELFYDEEFIRKVDSNPDIICFNNCVIDFKEKQARNGTPEDYITKCTGINYKKLNTERDKVIIDEIEDFMHKLFPNKELYKYMWEHLASTLIGNTSNQTFNMYIGVGQNGKSVLVNLMEQVLGQYKGDVPLTLITQQRTKIGGVSPEIIQLKGVRYAVMQEPSKGDKINEGIMKQLSAGDALTGRAPFMVESQTFTPQFKLIVCSNEFMEIKTQDHGTWRRIRVVDFESLFTDNPRSDDPEKPYQYKLDKNIKEKFNSWKEIFASMLVEIAYKTEGNVEDCDKVMSSSNQYRKGQDILNEYLQERVETHPMGCITKGQLGSNFKEWYTLNYGTGKSNNVKDLVLAMDKRFHKNIGGVWKGVHFIQIKIGQDEDDETSMNTNENVDENAFDLEEL